VELEVGALVDQPGPVTVEDVAVVVVLGEDVLDRLPRGLEEIRALPGGRRYCSRL